LVTMMRWFSLRQGGFHLGILFAMTSSNQRLFCLLAYWFFITLLVLYFSNVVKSKLCFAWFVCAERK
jgi:hypothetical protein